MHLRGLNAWTAGSIAAMLVSCVCIAVAEEKVNESAAKKTITSLQLKLSDIRKQTADAQKDAEWKQRQYLQLEHDIVYTNKVLSKIYFEMKDLEKKHVEKMKELNDAMMKSPEMRKADKERSEAFKKVGDLKSLDEGVMQDIRREQMKVGISTNR